MSRGPRHVAARNTRCPRKISRGVPDGLAAAALHPQPGRGSKSRCSPVGKRLQDRSRRFDGCAALAIAASSQSLDPDIKSKVGKTYRG